MKKTLLILLLLITMQVQAESGFGFNDGDIGNSGFNDGNIKNSGFNDGDIGNSGFNDGNIMLGGDGNNSSAGAGLGNRNNSSELYSANPFSNSGKSGVPKLSLMGIVAWLAGLMNQLIYLIIAASLVIFLYGILKLSFVDGQKPEAREQARKFMFWGIVSLFVMVSVWGLVNILKVSLFGPGDLIIPRLK